MKFEFETTEEIEIPKRLIDQVIGQEKAKKIIEQAAIQRRHVLLIGKPGTGKSMLAKALAELISNKDLEDFLVYPNHKDPYNPIVVTVPAGEGKKIVEEEFKKNLSKAMKEISISNKSIILFLIIILIANLLSSLIYTLDQNNVILLAADRISFTIFFVSLFFILALLLATPKLPQIDPVRIAKRNTPKLLIDNSNTKIPFVDATMSTENVLLGDVLHDPYQCIPKGEKVLTKYGLIPVELLIEYIKKTGERDILLGYDNEIKVIKVEEIYERDYKGKLIKIKTRSREILVTPNHPIAKAEFNIENKDNKLVGVVNIVYTEAKNLKKGDFVYVVDSIKDSFYLSIDEIEKIEFINYEGKIYNFKTSTGNFIVNYILTHNSGGLETPPHLRVVPGLIHKAHKGVLFIDEIATLKLDLQISLLTAMQEKKFPISGRSPHSAGSIVKTNPAPCDFILVAAGTPETIKMMHPALRSRIRGYGYEVYMEDKMEDNEENRYKIARFVAQEVVKENLPHFKKDAVLEIINEARRLAGKKGYLTLQLRELGGLVRIAGDIAKKKNKKYVEREDVLEAKELAMPLEYQIAKRIAQEYKRYNLIKTKGEEIGRVNGLAVLQIGDRGYGLVMSIYSTITPSARKSNLEIFATGNLQKIAREAVQNVFAIIKRYKLREENVNYDIHIQFFPSYPGGIEGDSASIAIATAIISSLENIPIKQNFALTGSLSIRGDVLPVGGINEKISAAKEMGIENVVIPYSNLDDIYIDLNDINIIPVKKFDEVLENVLAEWEKKKEVIKRIKEVLY